MKEEGLKSCADMLVHESALKDFFREKDIYESGHIMPMFDHIFRHILGLNNLEVFSMTFNRNIVGNSLIGKIKELVYKLFTYYIDENEGVISIYKIRLIK